MTAPDTLWAVALASLALYGIGLPIAWLLPAPVGARWLHRIAIAPVYSILVAVLFAWLLRAMGAALHPAQLVGLTVVFWLTSWRISGAEWDVRGALQHALMPALLAASAVSLWAVSLVGYGLYLPNRDFKNHAYMVAMVASLRTGDPDLILRQSPVDPPSALATYPIGLHTLLGWALPTEVWSSVGITAAAAVVCTSVSLPLAFVVLARMWRPMPRGLDWLAGAAAVCLPGLTSHFFYGSVVILVGTSLYGAGLAVLWLWHEQPTRSTSLALAATCAGLFVFHMAEAIGLVLVLGLLALLHPKAYLARLAGRRALVAVGLGATAVLGVLLFVGFERLAPLVVHAPLASNTLDATRAALGSTFHAVGQPHFLGPIWVALTVAGVWLTLSSGRSRLPLTALAVPWAVHVLATWECIPAVMRLASLPWYGEGESISLMAGAPMVLIAGLALLQLANAPMRHLWSRRASYLIACLTAVILLGAGLLNTMAQRRGHLASTLAGAGDTGELAARLSMILEPGEVVLNSESDGTANLFAFARVPVLAAFGYSTVRSEDGMTVEELAQHLTQLSDPDVAAAMKSLAVRYIVVGTTSLYWGQSPGYSMEELLSQEQLSLTLRGTDMDVLRYEP